MVNIPRRSVSRRIRKIHRYLGLFLGVQFLMWTLSGLYFSWTDIDEIHGDHFRQNPPEIAFEGLRGFSELEYTQPVSSVVFKQLGGVPYYWVNDSVLIHAQSGRIKSGITEAEAIQVAKSYVLQDLEVVSVELLTHVDAHHEYRGKPLPAYAISLGTEDQIVAFVSQREGSFQAIRHKQWRWFDFLWMMHTMDYQSRDNFNTTLLRGFSLLGLVTVLSGFTLWGVSTSLFRQRKAK